jgi:hypothetical protein
MRGYRGQKGTSFNFNSDFSGDLILETREEPELHELVIPSSCGTPQYRYWRVKVPASDVWELVLTRLAHRAVSMLEDDHGLVEIIAEAAIRFLDHSGGKLLRRLLLVPDHVPDAGDR